MGASCSMNDSTEATAPSSDATLTNAPPVTKQLIDLLGPTLLSNGAGKVSTASALAGKSVAIYFSAHWCPPCRGFTPKLAEAYTKHLKAKGLEVIFVSSDRDNTAFVDYFKSMPWLAVPFNARGVTDALSKKYSVRGIPSLILIDETGKLVDADGRGKVMSDPSGKWVRAPPRAKAPSLQGVLGSEPLLATDGQTRVALADAVEGAPLVGLYFSAHWCGPCRGFTPKLVTFVEMLQEEGTTLPIIFGSSDNSEAAFQDYFKSMPWLAFPHGDRRIEALKSKYGCSGIPWLVILDAHGNLVVNEADTDVPKGPQVYKEWLAKAERAAGKLMAGAPAA